MEKEKQEGQELWSDFESGLIRLLNEKVDVQKDTLEKDLLDIQKYFATFLNEIVTAVVLTDIGEKASKNNWATNTVERFLSDLDEDDYENIKFPKETSHYDLLNWNFFNFNYTPLFDNYIYLDKLQFNPRPYRVADRNSRFFPNPKSVGSTIENGNSRTRWSTYVMTDIIHPHGVQNIPKSMLFGFDNENQVSNNQHKVMSVSFTKPYWGQNEKRYQHLFNDTRLFITFGLSFGRTDEWWWKEIVKSLAETNAELIIYNFMGNANYQNKEEIKEKIISRASLKLKQDEYKRITKKIFIVNFSENNPSIAFSIKS